MTKYQMLSFREDGAPKFNQMYEIDSIFFSYCYMSKQTLLYCYNWMSEQSMFISLNTT